MEPFIGSTTDQLRPVPLLESRTTVIVCPTRKSYSIPLSASVSAPWGTLARAPSFSDDWLAATEVLLEVMVPLLLLPEVIFESAFMASAMSGDPWLALGFPFWQPHTARTKTPA